jgi:hypothetical protein
MQQKPIFMHLPSKTRFCSKNAIFSIFHQKHAFFDFSAKTQKTRFCSFFAKNAIFDKNAVF